MHAAETRLLYDNACTGIVSTIVIATLLAYAQWNVKPPAVVLAWLLYVVLVSAGRYGLVRCYRRASPTEIDSGRWSVAFAVGTAMAASGWVAAAIILYSPARPMNEAFLVFVVGGVMLGGASLLAARPEAFLTFLLPTGLFTTLVFLDIGLPVMNGYSVARTLRDLPELSRVYIAAVTGWGRKMIFGKHEKRESTATSRNLSLPRCWKTCLA